MTVTIHRPDQKEPLEVSFQQRDGRLLVHGPRIQVYAVISVEYHAD
jgi:hypothetical protein